MKRFLRSVVQALVAGVVLVLPVYLSILVLLKAMKSLEKVVRPLVRLLPKSFPAEPVVSLFIILVLCLLVGILAGTPLGQATRIRIENSVLQRIPGYEMFQSMTRQLTGEKQETAWKPALAEIEGAFVPAFIVEELDDGRFTVFVPSVPTPLAGAIYILSAERVHPLDVPFTQALKVVTRWGSGAKALVDAMENRRTPSGVRK